MHRPTIGLFLLALGLISGCGGSPAESTFTAPPHGGNLVLLPDSIGHVELKTESDAASKGSRKAVVKSRIVAYFYQPDGAAALSPAPTDVKVTLGAVGKGTVVSLAPETTEPGRFASEPGTYPDELRGQIDFQHAGKPVQATFMFR
jgi:hypothetical protein